MEMMRWSARRKLSVSVIHSSFNLFASKSIGATACGVQNSKIYPSSSSQLLSSSAAATATVGNTFPKPILFQTRYLHHVNPPNQGWFDWLVDDFKTKCRETVPFTKRIRYLLFSLDFDLFFNKIFQHYMPRHILIAALTKALHPESKHDLKITPKIHPQSIRVMWILQDILDALGKSVYMHTKEDVKATTDHLLGWKWEIVIVDHPGVFAFYLPGGMIFVYRGFLQRFNNDAEIAMMIGLQVAHIAARHIPERLTNKISYAMINLITFLPNYLLSLVNISTKIQQLVEDLALQPEVRELEADYIALMLIASAGYDPQIAPKVYDKLYQITSHYPFCVKRINFLNQVMGQALNVHNQLEAAYWILPRRLGGLRLVKKV